MTKLKYKKIFLFAGILLAYFLFEIVYILLGIDYDNITINEQVLLMIGKYLFLVI